MLLGLLLGSTLLVHSMYSAMNSLLCLQTEAAGLPCGGSSSITCASFCWCRSGTSFDLIASRWTLTNFGHIASAEVVIPFCFLPCRAEERTPEDCYSRLQSPGSYCWQRVAVDSLQQQCIPEHLSTSSSSSVSNSVSSRHNCA